MLVCTVPGVYVVGLSLLVLAERVLTVIVLVPNCCVQEKFHVFKINIVNSLGGRVNWAWPEFILLNSS